MRFIFSWVRTFLDDSNNGLRILIDYLSQIQESGGLPYVNAIRVRFETIEGYIFTAMRLICKVRRRLRTATEMVLSTSVRIIR